MTGPVSTVEIEDLLSSVRRLVADQTEQNGAAASNRVDDRLVLTPSLRVDAAENAGQTEVVPVRSSDLRQQAGLERRDDANAHAAGLDEDAEMGAANAALQGLLTLSADLAVSLPDPLQNDPGEMQVAAARALSVTAPDDLPDPEAALPEIEPEGAASAEPAEHIDFPAEATGQAQARHAALEATIAELEEAVLRSSVEWEPDGSEAQSASVTWPSEAAAPEENAVAHEDAPQDGARHSEANEPSAVALEGSVLDEDELRALIREVLTEELRGEMGLRVTRNLRKLVRREIYRILAVDELKD